MLTAPFCIGEQAASAPNRTAVTGAVASTSKRAPPDAVMPPSAPPRDDDAAPPSKRAKKVRPHCFQLPSDSLCSLAPPLGANPALHRVHRHRARAYTANGSQELCSVVCVQEGASASHQETHVSGDGARACPPSTLPGV
jgi:hypothetical protein